MDGSVLFAILVVGAVLVFMLTGADRGATTIGRLFSAPQLGWPSGVQEDDDVAWRWRDATGHSPESPAPTRPPGAAAGASPPTRPQPRLGKSRQQSAGRAPAP